MLSAMKIELKGMQFYGYHGVQKEERVLGQLFEVDVILEGDFTRAGQTDEVADTLDYRLLYGAVKKIVEGKPVHLLEHLAQEILQTIFFFSLVKKAVVKVKKPQVSLGGALVYAAVEVAGCRNEQ